MATTLAYVCERYLDNVNATMSPFTGETYAVGLRRLRSYLARTRGLLSVRNLSVDDIIAYFQWLPTQRLSARSIATYAAAAAGLWGWMVMTGDVYVTEHDTARFNAARRALSTRRALMPKVPRMDHVIAVREQALRERTLVGDHYAQRNRALVELMFTTGCRVGEIARLVVDDVDVAGRQVTVRGKGGKVRSIPMTAEVIELLRDYWVRVAATHAAPAFSTGRRPTGALSTNAIRKVIVGLAARAGLPAGAVTPHSFRHAFASHMLRHTGRVELVQKLLGHASIDTTMIYAELLDDDVRAAYDGAFEER